MDTAQGILIFMTTDCLFCRIISGEIPSHKVYEDENILAFLDIRPVNPGHILIIPKHHSPDIYTLPPEHLRYIADAAQKTARLLKESGAEGVNIIMNNGSAADQVIFHAHIHVIPRFADDGHEPWHGSAESPEKLAEQAENLRKTLSRIS